MNFINALQTIQKYGGHIRRLSFPATQVFINDNNLYFIEYDNEQEKNIISEAVLSGKDIMAEDWEVNLLGKFVNESL